MAEFVDLLQDTSRMSLQNPTEPGTLQRPLVPPELLQVIFEHAIPPSFLVDLSASFSPTSLWCRVLQQKLSLLNVCWTCYRIGVPFLYEDVAIGRVYQLGNLLRTLESSDSSYLKDMINTLSVHCFIPRSFQAFFKVQLTQLFKICPRLTTFSSTSSSYPPSLVALPSLPPTLTHLEVGEEIDLSVLQEVFQSLSTNLVSLSIYTDIHDSDSYSFPRLESMSFAIGMEQRVSSWELPRLRNLTLRVYFWRNPFSSKRVEPFLKKNGAQLKFFHIHPETDCGCMSEFIVDIEGILKLCPSLQRFVLHPRPVPPVIHQHIKRFNIGNDIRDSQTTGPDHRIITAPFPSLKTLRRPLQIWTTWDACFKDLKSNFTVAVTRLRGIHQCLGVDVHDDVGEIFVYVSDVSWPWTDNSPDREYVPSSTSSEEGESDSDLEGGDSDSGSESDLWDVGSEKDMDATWEAQMDLLTEPAGT
ncbi:hypothetical protein M413DRAFT_441972 [Hebeloma cylindrosporum]|uniref:F-box domain-containing protein n=1 Tax=Hebeloma cylindrosporum TaxID=76867 RepID=A0A0C2YWC1_HEBCY|nr:hypothetical protein M413DRAFT_441972 [Hebeloma cylindrosporum h7]